MKSSPRGHVAFLTKESVAHTSLLRWTTRATCPHSTRRATRPRPTLPSRATLPKDTRLRARRCRSAIPCRATALLRTLVARMAPSLSPSPRCVFLSCFSHKLVCFFVACMHCCEPHRAWGKVLSMIICSHNSLLPVSAIRPPRPFFFIVIIIEIPRSHRSARSSSNSRSPRAAWRA